MLKKILNILLICSVVTLTACATHGEKNPDDPIEPFNRKMYALNQWIDVRFFRPVAVVYTMIVPAPARKSVTNFFNNVDELPTIINATLQGEGKLAGNSVTRLAINSTIGVAGLFDPATKMGFAREPVTLSQTFYKWGWTNSTYLFVPFVGPTSTRDFTGLLGSLYMTPWPYLDDVTEWSAVSLMAINLRSQYLESEALLGVAALDEYAFLRDAYLQNRRAFFSGQAEDDTWAEDNEEWIFDNAATGPE
jgi:phospholipid-binding lipoprotein MlaA